MMGGGGPGAMGMGAPPPGAGYGGGGGGGYGGGSGSAGASPPTSTGTTRGAAVGAKGGKVGIAMTDRILDHQIELTKSGTFSSDMSAFIQTMCQNYVFTSSQVENSLF
jgi:hypothetical protein